MKTQWRIAWSAGLITLAVHASAWANILIADYFTAVSVKQWDADGNVVNHLSTPAFYPFAVPGGAWGIAVSPSKDHIYVGAYNDPGSTPTTVYRLHANGTLDTSWGVGGAVALSAGGINWQQADGMTIGPDGSLYVAVNAPTPSSFTRVLKVNTVTGAVSAFAASGALGAVTDVKFGPDGHLYVASISIGGIVRFNGVSGLLIDTPIPYDPDGTTGTEVPYGIAFDAAGNLYVMDRDQYGTGPTGLYRIRRFDSSFNYLGDWTYGSWSQPYGINIDANGNIFSSDFGGTGQILLWDPVTGTPTLFAAKGAGGLAYIAFIPEPTSGAAALLGIGALGWFRRRRGLVT